MADTDTETLRLGTFPLTDKIYTAEQVDAKIGEEIGKAIDGVHADLDGLEDLVDSVRDDVSAMLDGAPEALDTLKEIADWVGDPSNDVPSLVEGVRELRDALGGKQDAVTVKVVPAGDSSAQGVVQLPVDPLFHVFGSSTVYAAPFTGVGQSGTTCNGVQFSMVRTPSYLTFAGDGAKVFDGSYNIEVTPELVGATLGDRGFSEWTVTVSQPQGAFFEAVGQPYYDEDENHWKLRVRYLVDGSDEWDEAVYDGTGDPDSTHVVIGVYFDCTRRRLPGYTLGSQTDKPVAAAEDLEDKVDKPQLFTAGNLAAFDISGNLADSQVDPTGLATQSDLAYSLPATVYAAEPLSSATMVDRAIVTVDGSSGLDVLTLVFPTYTQGRARDFLLRLVCEGSALTAINLPADEFVDIGASDLASVYGKVGIHLIRFTEIAANHWAISARSAS